MTRQSHSALWFNSVAVLDGSACPLHSLIYSMAIFTDLSLTWLILFSLNTPTLHALAIDGLGGVTNSMSDDAKNAAEKRGVAYVYYIFLGT